MSKQDLILMIEELNKIQLNNYNELKRQYKVIEQNEKEFGAKKFGGKNYLNGVRSGLLLGMVLLDENLKSKVMNFQVVNFLMKN